nr:retrovirus-related Pol polyprotein from transposon TNT 1-94 [Tanacetum cinerariifolium]
MIIKKDSEIVKAKRERRSLTLKAKKESRDEECSTSGSEEEEYAMAVRYFKKFFKRRGRFIRQPRNEKRPFKETKMTRTNQRAFVGGSWSDSSEEDDEKIKDETCLIAQASNEICLGVDLEPDEWIRDSGCSKHMTGKSSSPLTRHTMERNRYTLVIVDDYSRYTWTIFLKDKIEAFDQFEIFSKKIQNQLGCTIVSIRTDHGREFDNEVQFEEFCNANEITHNFSAPRTPQSNDVVERKNRALQEMSRTMLNAQSLPQKF